MEWTLEAIIAMCAAIIETGALLGAIIALKQGADQELYADRRDAYITCKELLETYKWYLHKCYEYKEDNKEITMKNRFEWLINSYRFYDLKEAIELKNREKDKTVILQTCAELNCTAETISLLWPRCHWYAKGLRDFIRLYAQVLTHILGYLDFKQKSDAKEKELKALNQDDPKFEEVLQELQEYAHKVQCAYDAASEAEEAMNAVYTNYIEKKPKKRIKDKGNKPEAALMAMKDSIRLEKPLFRKR